MVIKNRIVFRADGNLIAGYGHVIRALSLASILKHKYNIVFIIQEPDDFLRTQIKKICSEIVEIPASKNLLAESKTLAKKIIRAGDIVVLDGYGYNADYQKEIKKNCFKLVCIDDIHDHHFIADAIINHGEGIKRKEYSIERFSKLYLGTKYAILRKSFLKKSQVPSFFKTEYHKAFISMGGTDQQNYTQKALKICIRNKKIKKIDLVVGSFYPYSNELEEIIISNKHATVQVHHNLSETEICSLMKRSTVAICSASTVSYEYASVGGLLFIYQTVLNQKNIYAFLIRSKVAYPARSFDKILTLFKNQATAKNYFTNRRAYFSGDSAKNLLSVFEKLEKERGISIRLAKQNDVLIYFKWANDPIVRNNSVSTAPILLEDHKKWFFSKLKNKNSRLYIIEKNATPLGQVRLDREYAGTEIDYSVGKTYRGKGYGEIILKNAITEHYKKFANEVILAKVKESNQASNRVFEKLGFKKTGSTFQDGIKYYRYLLKGH